MAKIPFSIDYRPQIESGEYKVETRDGRPVKIIYWEAKGPAPIIGLFMTDDGSETTTEVHPNGRWSADESYESFDDLFIVTPGKEMTDFEKKLWEVLKSEGSPIGPIEKFTNVDEEVFHSYAAELLALAREQFIKDGYVIVKKAFLEAVEKVDPEVMKEVSENVDKTVLTEFERKVKQLMGSYPVATRENHGSLIYEVRKAADEVLSLAREQLQPEIDAEIEKAYKNADDVQYRKGFEDGKAEALNDLPKWRIWENGACGNSNAIPIALVKTNGSYKLASVLGITGEKYIMLSDLEKLPGFKED